MPPHKWNVSAIVQRLILNLETLHTIEFPQQNTCSAFWAILELLEKQTNNIKNAFLWWFLILKFKVGTWISTVVWSVPEVSEFVLGNVDFLHGWNTKTSTSWMSKAEIEGYGSFPHTFVKFRSVCVCIFSLFQCQYLFWVVHIYLKKFCLWDCNPNEWIDHFQLISRVR